MLHAQNGQWIEFDAADELLQAGHCVIEENLSPICEGVDPEIGEIRIDVRACIPRVEGVDEPIVFDDY